MKTRTTKIAGWGLIALTVFCLGFAGGAYAEKGGKGRGHDDHYEDVGRHSDHNDDYSHHGRGDDDDKLWIRIGDDERSIITKYLGDDHRRHCPPGLAKKNNGCLPPGIAKKYAIGQTLPDGIWTPLPDDLRGLLKPVPGHQYVQVDKDILLIGEATKKVVDAVTLISAVGE